MQVRISEERAQALTNELNQKGILIILEEARLFSDSDVSNIRNPNIQALLIRGQLSPREVLALMPKHIRLINSNPEGLSAANSFYQYCIDNREKHSTRPPLSMLKITPTYEQRWQEQALCRARNIACIVFMCSSKLQACFSFTTWKFEVSLIELEEFYTNRPVRTTLEAASGTLLLVRYMLSTDTQAAAASSAEQQQVAARLT